MSNGSKINLLQMQKYFEGRISNVPIISDMELSENDYRSLGLKLKALSFFTGSENDMEKYMLSIVVHSVYTLIYGCDYEDFDSVMWMVMHKSQYMERMRMRMYRDVFDAHGIMTYNVSGARDIKQECQWLTAIHAGIPNSEKSVYFDLMSNYLECGDVEDIYNDIFKQLPQRTRLIFRLMNEENRKQCIMDSRTLVMEVMDEYLSRDQIIKKYPHISISLIDHCIMWNENNKYQIRFHIN